MKYAIYEGNLDRLEKKLKRIFNKCKAYGCDFHYEQTGEEFRELKDEKGNKYTARFVLVEAEGTAVINDWEFVAELEHTEKVFAPFGISYEKKSQATLSPTNEELKKGENWTLVHSGETTESKRSYINHKAVPIARIISRG